MTINQMFIDAAQRSHAKVYPRGPFTSVILAQFGIESNWGTEPSGDHNYFGIKANKSQIAAMQCTIRWTHETLPSGQYVKIAQYFADYDTIDECFDAHAALLCTSHYIDCQHAATPEEYCHALWADGYATGIPGHPYDTVLINVINTMNLKQYDLPRATVLAQTKGANMFNFLSLFSMVEGASTILPQAVQIGETLVTDVKEIATSPAVLAIETWINANFSHVSTPGAASILEPKK